MTDYKFSQIRLQLLLLADSDPQLSDKGLRVLLRLLMQHLNWSDGTWSTTDAELASEFGCSTDTISRAVASIERSGLLDVARGRWGRASRYSVSERAWRQALELRGKPRKNADQGDSCTQQKSGISTANLRSSSPQSCAPSYKKEIEERNQDESEEKTFSLVGPNDNNLFSVRRGPGGEQLSFVPRGICFLRTWNKRLENEGMRPIERSLPLEGVGINAGYWLPDKYPAPSGSNQWAEQVALIRQLAVIARDTRGASCQAGGVS